MFPIRSNVPSRGAAPFTLLLVIANVLFFFYEILLPAPALDALVATYGMVPARETALLLHEPTALSGWLLPIATSMFLHGGWAHLVGNMLFLWVFGRALEPTIGSRRFLLVYLLGGLAASQIQFVVAPLSQIPMIGASGAVAAVLGAHLFLFPRASVTVLFPILIFPLFFEVPAVLFLGIWFLEQIWAGTLWSLSPLAAQAGGVAWWAHVGGFIAGFALVVSMARRLARARERRVRRAALRPSPEYARWESRVRSAGP
jgi:membrane associated rhomboid family serine protease